MVIGAAKHAPRGHAIGVDIWDRQDLSGNTPARALRNASLEGVADRVGVQDGGARALSFADGAFDVILSTLCLHNISEGRDRGVRELVRVLAPAGVIVISDLAETEEVAALFGGAGLTVTRSGRVWDTFPVQRIVVGRR